MVYLGNWGKVTRNHMHVMTMNNSQSVGRLIKQLNFLLLKGTVRPSVIEGLFQVVRQTIFSVLVVVYNY